MSIETPIISTKREDVVLFPRAKSITVLTGNIVSHAKRNVVQTATSELSHCISATMKTWLESLDSECIQNLKSTENVECANQSLLSALNTDERQDYKITVKIFLNTLQEEAVEDAINNVMSDLGVTSIEIVILSVSDKLHELSDLKVPWHALEKQVTANRVYSLGISDLNKTELENLYNFVQVKPVINQVNLTTCCVIPVELTEYAKEHDIQLLTHNDPPVILSDAECGSLLSSSLTSSDGQHWQPYWVARYTVLVKARGIIQTKGYIMKATRELHA